MVVALVVISILLALYGLFTLTQATMGAGLVAAACFFAILARIAQAQAQHYEAMIVARADPLSGDEAARDKAAKRP